MFGLIIDIFSPNFTMLMIGRIFQAAGNGILTSMAQVVLLSIYPKEEAGSVMGLYGLSVGAAPVIAPTIAGFIVDHMRWQMIFVIALIIIAISFALAIFVFDDILDNWKHRKLCIIKYKYYSAYYSRNYSYDYICIQTATHGNAIS